MTNAHPLLLVAHPDNPPLPVERVVAAVCPLAEGGVRLRYRLACPADALRSVTPAPPGFADDLWRHTCFEAFFASTGGVAYREFNFSADGRWAGYCFDAWRERRADLRAQPPPRVAVAWRRQGLEVDAELSAALLDDTDCFDLGLSAVIEGRDGALGYWALRHGPGAADFHRRDGFCYRLARNRRGGPA